LANGPATVLHNSRKKQKGERRKLATKSLLQKCSNVWGLFAAMMLMATVLMHALCLSFEQTVLSHHCPKWHNDVFHHVLKQQLHANLKSNKNEFAVAMLFFKLIN